MSFLMYNCILSEVTCHCWAEVSVVVSEVLLRAGSICPDMCKREVDAVKHKHRSPKYCEQLLQALAGMPQAQS